MDKSMIRKIEKKEVEELKKTKRLIVTKDNKSEEKDSK